MQSTWVKFYKKKCKKFVIGDMKYIERYHKTLVDALKV